MVAGFPHPVLGQDIEAFLVLREARTLDQVKDRVLNRVGEHICPSQFWTVAEIPRNARGKVDRRAAEQLRARATPLTRNDSTQRVQTLVDFHVPRRKSSSDATA